MAKRVEGSMTHLPWWAWAGSAVGRAMYRYRWHLAPVYVLAATGPVGLVAATAGRLLGWAWVAGAYAVTVVIVAALIGAHVRSSYDKAVAGVGYGAAGAYSALIAVSPLDRGLWLLLPFGIVLGVPWWCGPTLKPRVQMDRLRERFRWSVLAEDGGGVVGDERVGPVRRVRLRLGRRWRDGDKAAVADLLGEPDGAVIVQPDPRTNGRSVEVTILDTHDFGGPEVPHPALKPGATADGGPWARGARRIADPIPLGDARTGDPGFIRLRGPEGWRHGALFGASGSGKSNTASVLAVGVCSTVDGVLVASDVAKQGVTFKPWRDALGGVAVPADIPALALTAEDTERQVDWLLGECKRRGEQVADSDDDVWQAGPGRAAAIVYCVSEAAALFTEAPELAAGVTDLVLLGRQVGIAVVIESQGGDWDSIPTKLRQNLMWSITHRMEPDALRTVWKGLAGQVDMSLFTVPGLLYHRDGQVGGGGGDMVPVRSHALYRNADKRRLAGVYRTGRSDSAAPASSTAETKTSRKRVEMTKAAASADAARERLDQELAELAELDPQFPPGPLAEVFAQRAPEPVVDTALDEVESERTLAVLVSAGDAGASRSAVAQALDVSDSTALRRLAALRTQGRVRASGRGAATRWHAERQLAEV